MEKLAFKFKVRVADLKHPLMYAEDANGMYWKMWFDGIDHKSEQIGLSEYAAGLSLNML